MKKYKNLFPLFIIQFFTWLGLFSLWIYATPVVTKYIFKTVNSETPEYENTIQWIGICFALYSLFGASLTFYLHKILKKNNKYLVHSVALFLGSFGLMSIYFVHSQYILLISFLFIGIGWSSISTVPYLLVGKLAPEEESENYFSVFNFSTVIPQAIAAFLLSFITKSIFHGETSKTLFTGGIFMFLAAIITFIVSKFDNTK